jgi:antitoxin component YwqK of YwqJK toxin-antitoxin module
MLEIRLICSFCCILFASAVAAESVNQLDPQGNRQGLWTITGNIARDVKYPGNGRVEEGNYIDGRKVGIWKRYWPSGKLRSEINYASGLPSGTYTLYYENGKPEETGTWQYGRYTGVFKRFYPNGKIQQVLNYNQEGWADGSQEHYYDDGSTAMTCTMKSGKEQGKIIWFEPRGVKFSVVQMTDGFNNSSHVLATHSDNMGLPWLNIYPGEIGKEATATEYQTNSAQKFEADNYNVLYDRTGQLMQSGYFRKGILHKGKWYFYNSDGIMTAIRYYSDGRFIGNYPMPRNRK